MNSLAVINHSVARPQQRGITDEMIDTVLRYGEEFFQPGSRRLILIPKKKARRLRLPDEVTGIGLIVQDNTLITCMHVFRKIFQKKNNPRRRWRRP